MTSKLNFKIPKAFKILFGILMYFCFCENIVAQYNVSYDCASVLGKGQGAISGYYSGYRFSYSGNSYKLFNLLGFRLTAGVSESFDISASYGRFYGGLLENQGANYIEVSPKISLSKGRASLLLPIGVYFAGGENSFILSPKLLFTFTSGPTFDLTFSPKAEILLKSPSDELIEFSLGAGLSSNLDRWAIRPEIGLVFNPGERGSIFTYGIGFNSHF